MGEHNSHEHLVELLVVLEKIMDEIMDEVKSRGRVACPLCYRVCGGYLELSGSRTVDWVD